jgi:hypothetical protein
LCCLRRGLDQATFEKNSLLIFEKNTLSEEGMMVIEHSKYTKLNHMPHFSFQKLRSSILHFEFESTEIPKPDTSEDSMKKNNETKNPLLGIFVFHIVYLSW